MSRGKQGEQNNKAKLVAADVIAIRSSLESQPTLSARYGVSIATISDIRTRRSWAHLPIQSQPECASLDGEEWRPVPLPEFSDRYFVSNFGRIKGGSTESSAIRIRRPKPIVQGYVVVVMCSNGRQRRHLIHRLVTRAFLGEPPPQHVVNHIDGNKANNALANLEYVTPQGNTLHAIDMGLIESPKGEGNPRAKLRRVDIDEIRNSAMQGNRIAERFGVHKDTIYRIRRREIWSHL